ncbi:hypothetical protein ABKN59_007133 [Abortiporus biennis]
MLADLLHIDHDSMICLEVNRFPSVDPLTFGRRENNSQIALNLITTLANEVSRSFCRGIVAGNSHEGHGEPW